MKTITGILFLIFFSTVVCGQIKEIKSSKLSRLENPKSKDESQLRIDFTLPTLPATAHIMQMTLVLEQDFDSQDTPKGLVNKTSDPVTLSVVAFDSKSAEVNDKWIDAVSMVSKKSVSGRVAPTTIIQSERKAGNWSNKAVHVSVDEIVREFMASNTNDISFVVTGSRADQRAIKSSKVEVDVTKLSAKLVIHYVDEPQSPPWLKKK